MKFNFWNIFRYGISLALAIALLAYVLQGISWDDLLHKFQEADYTWILVAAVLSVLSHLSRAHRWLLLLAPLDYHPSTFRSFLAVMSGYFMNFVLPRAGELTRCGVINRLEKVPFSTAFGTIVLERIIDVLVLLLIILFVVFIEIDRVGSWILLELSQKIPGESVRTQLLILASLGIFLMLLGGFIFWKWGQYTWFGQKIKGFFLNFLKGILSIRNVRKPGLFVGHTLLIWLLYYLTTYVLFFSFPETSKLSPWFALLVFVMGAIGMAAPVQGGVGAYHLLVSKIFALVALGPEYGVLIATFLHAVQTIITVGLGGMAFLLSTYLWNKKSADIDNSSENIVSAKRS